MTDIEVWNEHRHSCMTNVQASADLDVMSEKNSFYPLGQPDTMLLRKEQETILLYKEQTTLRLYALNTTHVISDGTVNPCRLTDPTVHHWQLLFRLLSVLETPYQTTRLTRFAKANLYGIFLLAPCNLH